jgi:hypothetical protein
MEACALYLLVFVVIICGIQLLLYMAWFLSPCISRNVNVALGVCVVVLVLFGSVGIYVCWRWVIDQWWVDIYV